MIRVVGNSAKSGFTLIELMVVIAIVGILIALSLPSFIGYGQGRALRSGEAQVRSALSLARQYAIMNNTSVRFIIAGPNAAYNATSGDVDKCLRAYAIYDVGKESSNPVDDKYAKEWEYLPQGVIFNYFKPYNSNSFSSIFQDLNSYQFKFPNSKSVANSRECYYVEFSPDGRANGAKAIILSDGSANWSVDGNVNEADEAQYYVNTNRPSRAILVFKRAGRIKSIDLQ